MTEKFRCAGDLLEVSLLRRRPRLVLGVGSDSCEMEIIEEGSSGKIVAEVGGRRVSGWRHVDGSDVFVRLNSRSYRFQRVLPGAAGSTSGGGDELRASMPGVVVSVECEPGQLVVKGQTLIVIESMKMQTAIPAPRDGIVELVHFARDAGFDKGAALVSLQQISE